MTSLPFVRAAYAAFVLLLLLAGLRAQTPSALDVKGMPERAPLTVSASHDGASLRVRADVKAGWHLYGRDVGGGKPVHVEITGGAFAAAGELATPMDEKGLITGAAELKLPLRRTGEGSELRATMTFMVCDALECLPPIELELSTRAAGAGAKEPPRVLLVAVEEGERADRIAQFLRERGIAVTVSSYAKVTAEQCDAHEVVLADSLTFMVQRAKKVNVKKFPQTRSPVVAVGFVGTQLLEENKIAMACGYI
jgi:hypothetical protein